MTIDLEDRVILDIIDDLGRPQGRYPEIFMLIFLLEVGQEWCVKNGASRMVGLGGR